MSPSPSAKISCARSLPDGTGGAGSVLSESESCASDSAAARAAISSSFTTLKLRVRPKLCANGSSALIVIGEGSGLGDRSSTSSWVETRWW